MGRYAEFLLRIGLGALTLGAAVLVLALPVHASATSQRTSAASRRATFFYTGSVKKHGVKIVLTAGQGPFGVIVAKCGGPCRILVSARPMKASSGHNGPRGAIAAVKPELSRGVRYLESDFFSFGAGIAYRPRHNLRSAHMAGTFARQRGSINMTFHATSGATKIPLGEGCTGRPGKKRKGALKGLFRFKAGRLGTLTVRSFPATLEIPRRENCPRPRRSHRVVHLVNVFSKRASGHVAEVDATRLRKGGVFENAMLSFHGPIPGSTWAFDYFLGVGPLPNADYAHASDLSAATITGGGPLHGTAKYTGTRRRGHSSHGRLGGDLSAHFATLGRVKLFPHGAVKAQQWEQ